MCRKAAETEDGGTIEVWGDGQQTRSFLHVNECVEAVLRLMRQDDFLGTCKHRFRRNGNHQSIGRNGN